MHNRCYVLLLLSLLLTPAAPSWGEDISDLLQSNDLTVIDTNQPRAPRPASKIAENATVITAEQIAVLNAHSLSDVLQTVPGVHISNSRTPGDFTFFSLQGEEDGRGNILLLIDGVSQGNLLQGTNDPGLIPVQHIERIEIIKGSASATWGAALGGVVNVVTKSPKQDSAFGGSATSSYGERNTAHLLGDVSGTVNRFGYYLFGSNLHSDGLLPNNATNRNNLYGKITYDLPVKGNFTLGSSYIDAKRGLTAVPDSALDNSRSHRSYSFINFAYPLLPDLKLEFSALNSNLYDNALFQLQPGNYLLKESNHGGKARVIWGDSNQRLTLGYDLLRSKITQTNLLDPTDPYNVDKSRESWAILANGLMTFGKLTILPGVRYDHTGLGENSTNYTLGATYQINDKTLIRGYAAKGYSLPDATVNNITQQIWTFQSGIETEAIPYLWLKGTLFHNHIWNIQEDPLLKKHDRYGAELEVKTVPLQGFFFSGGYTWMKTRDSETHDIIKGVPTSIAKLSLNYRNAPAGLTAVANGSYAWLNMEDYHLAHYKPIIWNLHLTQKIYPGKELSPEVFFSGHNLFNGSQYWDNWYLNAKRWVEGGVRFKF